MASQRSLETAGHLQRRKEKRMTRFELELEDPSATMVNDFFKKSREFLVTTPWCPTYEFLWMKFMHQDLVTRETPHHSVLRALKAHPWVPSTMSFVLGHEFHS